jgi:preprotein translocase subunit SecD
MSDNFLVKILQPKGKGKLWWAFVFITIISVSAFFVDFGNYYNEAVTKLSLNLPKVKEVPFRQGLDLQGGSQLLYQADVSRIAQADRVAAVNGARDVIERRVNFFGVSEPLVQVNQSANGDYRILVELAGIKDVNDAIKKIGETPLLEFKEQNLDAKGLTDDQKKELEKFNSEAKKKAELVLGKLLSGGDFTALAKSYSEDEKTKQNGGDLGWITTTEQPDIMAIVSKMKPVSTSKDLQKLASGYELFKLEGKRLRQEGTTDAKEYKASHILICYKGATSCEGNLSKDEAKAKIEDLKKQATPANFAELAKKNSTEPGADKSGGDLGWFGGSNMVKPFVDAIKPMAKGTISGVVETEFGFHLIYKQDERTITEYQVRHILVKTKTVEDILGPNDGWKNTQLSGKNLKRATVEFNPNDGAPEVGLEFDEEGAKLFEQITEANIGKPVAIYLDNYPISTPKVNEKISGGKAVINGKFTMQEAKDLSQSLNAGALPVPIELINQQTIGASLGKESVAKSLHAGLVGLLLVVIFMILMYRLPGVLASASLLVYGLIVLAIFKLWPVTLTLSGIAGFIMSIGVAVDANVLIFERLKEELRNGKTLSRALEDGFARAWTSVRDSNFTTIITCLVLIMFSTSVIKGFAVTLLLGVLVSLFTAVVVTRNFLKLIDERWLEKYSWLIYRTKKIKK